MGGLRYWLIVISSEREREEVRTVLLRWTLFETRLGEWLLALLERRAGLSVVHSDWLGAQPSVKLTAEEGG